MFLVPSTIAVQWAQTLKCASMRARISGATSPSRKLEISRQTSRQLISITFIGYGGFLLVSSAWLSLALPRPHLFVLLLAGEPAPINTRCQGIPHQEACSEKPCLATAFSNAKNPGSFLNAQVLDVPQYKHFPVFRGQGVQSSLQALSQLLPVECF